MAFLKRSRLRKPQAARLMRWTLATVMNDRRRQQADAGVVVLVVVPVEHRPEVAARVLDRAESLGEARPVFDGLELCLGERVVVGDVRSTVALADAEVGKEQREGLGGHRGAAVGVDGDLARLDAFTFVGIFDQALGQFRSLARCDHPADHVAAEDVEQHVEVEVGPLLRPEQPLQTIGEVPRTPVQTWFLGVFADLCPVDADPMRGCVCPACFRASISDIPRRPVTSRLVKPPGLGRPACAITRASGTHGATAAKTLSNKDANYAEDKGDNAERYENAPAHLVDFFNTTGTPEPK